MSLDDVFEYVGGGGAYQIFTFLLLAFPAFYGGYQTILMVFIGPDQDHWCKIDRLVNFSHSQQKYIAIPYNEDENAYERCVYYNLPYDDLTNEDLWNWNWTTKNPDNITQVKCNEWVFDQSEFLTTLQSEYNLVCHDSYKVSLASTLNLLGFSVATLIVGPLQHYLGRRPLILCSCLCMGPLCFLAALAPNYGLFVTARLLMSLFNIFGFTPGYVLILEIFGPKHRTLPGTVYFSFWAFGYILLSVVAFFIRDSTKLQLYLAIISLVPLLYFFILSESPRWFVANGKFKKAEKVLNEVAQVNGKKLSNETLEAIQKELMSNTTDKKEEHSSLVDIFIVPQLLKRILLLAPSWISCALVYYGLSLNIGSLPGNLYVISVVSGITEIASQVLSFILLTRLGRKTVLIFSLVFSGLMCLLCMPLVGNDDLSLLITVFAMIGRGASLMGWACLEMFTVESFPTQVRHNGYAVLVFLGGIGSVIAPFTGPPLMSVWTPLPLLLFGLSGVIAGVLVIFLPETRNSQMLDMVSEMNSKSKDSVKEDEETDEKIVDVTENTWM